MTTQYRIVEHRCINPETTKSLFYIQHKGWWPFWTYVGAAGYSHICNTLEEAQQTVRKWQLADATKCSNIVHPV